MFTLRDETDVDKHTGNMGLRDLGAEVWYVGYINDGMLRSILLYYS
jgi:hypothetical protein